MECHVPDKSLVSCNPIACEWPPQMLDCCCDLPCVQTPGWDLMQHVQIVALLSALSHTSDVYALLCVFRSFGSNGIEGTLPQEWSSLTAAEDL